MTHVITEHPYFGVFVLFALTAVAFPATLMLARIVSRKMARLDTEKLKLTIYECGPEVTKQPNTISAQFYLIALLFILFDVMHGRKEHLNGTASSKLRLSSRLADSIDFGRQIGKLGAFQLALAAYIRTRVLCDRNDGIGSIPLRL